MRPQSLQGVYWKFHITIKKQHKRVLCVFVPVVKVHLAGFIAFCRPDKYRGSVTSLSFNPFYGVAAFAVLIFTADYTDITRAFIQSVSLSAVRQ